MTTVTGICPLLSRTFRQPDAPWAYDRYQHRPTRSGHLRSSRRGLGPARHRLLGTLCDPGYLPLADTIDLCAVVALRHLRDTVNIGRSWVQLAGRAGIEPASLILGSKPGGPASRATGHQSPRQDLNLRPSAYKPAALAMLSYRGIVRSTGFEPARSSRTTSTSSWRVSQLRHERMEPPGGVEPPACPLRGDRSAG